MSSAPSFPYRVVFQNDCRHVVHLTGGCLPSHAGWLGDHTVSFEDGPSYDALEVSVRSSRRFRWWGGLSTRSTVVVSPGGKAVFRCCSSSPLRWDCRTQAQSTNATQYRFDRTKRGQENAEYFVKVRSSALMNPSELGWRGGVAHASIELISALSPNPLCRIQAGRHQYRAPQPTSPMKVCEEVAWGDWGDDLTDSVGVCDL